MKAHNNKANRKEADWKRLTKMISAAEDEDAPRSAAQLQALKRIGVSEEQLRTAPKIEPLLMLAEGGMKTILDAMRFAPDANITGYLVKYDSLSAADRSALPMEAVALAAGVDIRTLLGSVMYALQARSISLVRLLTTSSHPSIIRARIRYGQLPGGERDRTALDMALGLLPSPKGATIINKAIFGSGRSVMGEQKPERLLDGGPHDEDEDENEVPLAAAKSETEPDLDRLFPPANAMQEKLVAIRQKVLPTPKSHIN
jgi:hypothetical protein